MFSVYAWSFCYFLNEKYPEEFRTYLEMEFSGTGSTQEFCKLFGSDVVLVVEPSDKYEPRYLRRHWDTIVQIFEARQASLKDDAKITALNDEWAAWLIQLCE